MVTKQLVRCALLSVLAVMLFEVVISVASGTTGVAEKMVLVGLGLAITGAAAKTWRLGT